MRVAEPVPYSLRRVLRPGIAGGLAGCLAGCLAAAALAAVPHQVSQRGRAFLPNLLTVQAGAVVNFVNDDGDLLHHAYLETDSFSFDTGDQEPGSRTSVTFAKAGVFTVLCGIHPKMKLVVRVQ